MGEFMKTLITFVSTGKGTWGHVGRILNEEWDNTVIITNEFGREKFEGKPNTEWIVLSTRGLKDMANEIKEGLTGLDLSNVYVNIVSGSGKEHMALLKVLHDMKVDYKLAALTTDGYEEF